MTSSKPVGPSILLASLASALFALAVVACVDPGTAAGPARVPDDSPTANDPDLQASAAGMSAQPKSDAGIYNSGCGSTGC